MAKHPHLFENEIKGISPRTFGVNLTGSNGVAHDITGISNDFPASNPRNAYIYEKLLKELSKNIQNSTDVKIGSAAYKSIFPNQFPNVFRTGSVVPVFHVVASGHDDMTGLYRVAGTRTLSYRQVDSSGTLLGNGQFDRDFNQVGPTTFHPKWIFRDLTDGTPTETSASAVGIDHSPWAANFAGKVTFSGIASDKPTMTFFGSASGNPFFNTDYSPLLTNPSN